MQISQANNCLQLTAYMFLHIYRETVKRNMVLGGPQKQIGTTALGCDFERPLIVNVVEHQLLEIVLPVGRKSLRRSVHSTGTLTKQTERQLAG
jgi:hypothetical protein